MHLKNFPKVRVKQHPEGYAIEIQKRTWYGRKYWTHIISVSGIDCRPWYYDNEESAISQAQLYFKWDLIYYQNRN